MDQRSGWKWVGISGLVFGIFAGVFKAVFFPYPQFNPTATYPALIAFFLAVFLWWWLVAKPNQVTMLRGGIVGAIVGMLTPLIMWPLFLLFTAFAENRFPEVFLWSPVYMITSLTRIGWLTTLLGIVLGVVVAQFQSKLKIN